MGVCIGLKIGVNVLKGDSHGNVHRNKDTWIHKMKLKKSSLVKYFL